MNEKVDTIPHFIEAVLLVGVTQPSSAFIERVFSQLSFIRCTVGETSSRDTLELRAFVRCNNGLIDDLE